tara:strand:- start:9343 stop:9885 length:543 start_codon:yes stop_codon:yes gene_type:complete
MSKQQKKYTVYEVEKITNGKLSKYKLTKAIKAGQLKAERVDSNKKGRGIPNYFVYENDLQEYVDLLEETKKSTIRIPDVLINREPEEEKNEVYDSNDFVTKANFFFDTQKQAIETLMDRIHLLEKENSKILPLLEKQQFYINEEQSKSAERKELIMELASAPSFNAAKKKDILTKLNRLA